MEESGKCCVPDCVCFKGEIGLNSPVAPFGGALQLVGVKCTVKKNVGVYTYLILVFCLRHLGEDGVTFLANTEQPKFYEKINL